MTVVWGGVNPKLPISVLKTSITHFRGEEDLLIARSFLCCPLEQSGQGGGQALLEPGLLLLSPHPALDSSGFTVIHKITPRCRNTDIPSSPTGEVRPFSPLPTLCLSCPRPVSWSWTIPCPHFYLWWVHVWYGAAGASGCHIPGPRDCVTPTGPAGIWTNPQQCPGQAVVISKVRKPGGKRLLKISTVWGLSHYRIE